MELHGSTGRHRADPAAGLRAGRPLADATGDNAAVRTYLGLREVDPGIPAVPLLAAPTVQSSRHMTVRQMRAQRAVSQWAQQG